MPQYSYGNGSPISQMKCDKSKWNHLNYWNDMDIVNKCMRKENILSNIFMIMEICCLLNVIYELLLLSAYFIIHAFIYIYDSTNDK